MQQHKCSINHALRSKCLILLYLCIVKDIPDVDRIAGAENPAFSAN